MNSMRIQEIFNALRLHFTSDYDFVKYNGRAKVKNVAFSAGVLLKKLPDERRVIYYFLANQISYYMTNGRFCGHMPEIVNTESTAVYDGFLKSLKNIELNLTMDLEGFLAKHEIDKFKDLNLLTRMFHTKQISFLTLVQIYNFLKVKESWESEEDPLSKDLLMLVKKASPFLKFRKEKFLPVFRASVAKYVE